MDVESAHDGRCRSHGGLFPVQIMDGLEASRQIQARYPPHVRPRIVALSADTLQARPQRMRCSVTSGRRAAHLAFGSPRQRGARTGAGSCVICREPSAAVVGGCAVSPTVFRQEAVLQKA